MPIIWESMRRMRAYLPDSVAIENQGNAIRYVEEICRANGANVEVESMTDQFDVYRISAKGKREKIAVYMAA